jgi:hypothetical protein
VDTLADGQVGLDNIFWFVVENSRRACDLDSPLIFLNPLHESLSDFLYLAIGDLKPQTKIEERDQADKMGMVLGTLKTAAQQNRSDIHGPE